MKGSLSIKEVLPAVWFESAAVRAHPWFSAYSRKSEDRALDPYATLEPLAFGDDEESAEVDAVREGTAATEATRSNLSQKLLVAVSV